MCNINYTNLVTKFIYLQMPLIPVKSNKYKTRLTFQNTNFENNQKTKITHQIRLHHNCYKLTFTN